MKNLKVVMLTALTAVGLASCGSKEPAHTHTDANPADHVCDTCGENLGDHVDVNKDHVCDVCGEKTSEHVDVNHDGSCDYCGNPGMEVVHKDENGDGKCDVCGINIFAVKWELDLTDVQTSFIKGDAFNSDGLKVILTMSEGSTKVLTGSDLKVTKPTSWTTTAGTKKITVKFNAPVEENGEVVQKEQTLSYDVNVQYWTSSETSMMKQLANIGVSIFLDSGDYFPYMPGMTLVTDVQDNVLMDWYLKLEGATEDDVLAYNEILMSYKKVTKEQAYGTSCDLTYSFSGAELPLEAAESFGVDSDTAFAVSLIPILTVPDPDGAVDVRAYNVDEYFVIGINDDGDMIVRNRFANAYLEAYMGYDGFFDGQYSFGAGVLEGLADLLAKDLADRGSPYANGILSVPNYTGTYEYPIGLINYTSINPFEEGYDDYVIAFGVDLIGGTKVDRDDWVTELESKGFEAYNEEIEGEVTYTFYKYYSRFVGTMTVIVTNWASDFFSDEQGFHFEITYEDNYEEATNVELFTEVTLLPLLNVEVENATLDYEKAASGEASVTYTIENVETTADQVLTDILNHLTGFTVKNEPTELGEGTFAATVTDGLHLLSVSVNVAGGTATVSIVITNDVPDVTCEDVMKAIVDAWLEINPNAPANYNEAQGAFVYQDSVSFGKYSDYSYWKSVFSQYLPCIPAYMVELEAFNAYYEMPEYGYTSQNGVIGLAYYGLPDGSMEIEFFLFVNTSGKLTVQISVYVPEVPEE